MRTKNFPNMTSKNEALKIAKELMPLYEKYRDTKDLKMTLSETTKLKQLWERYLQGTNLNTTCGSCVAYALTVMATWYNREAQPIAPTPVTEQPIQADGPITIPIKKKPGRPKKNK